MQVTASTKTPEGLLFRLNNGDSLLMKEALTCGGKPCVYPVYVFASGHTYSARNGRFSESTVRPAMAAVLRFQA